MKIEYIDLNDCGIDRGKYYWVDNPKAGKCRKNNYGRKKKISKRRRRKRIIVFLYLLLSLLIVFFVAYNIGFIKIVEECYLSVMQPDIDVPENIIEFGEKYPEAKTFVNEYPKYYGRDLHIDIAEEVDSSDIPLFIQWDRRWGYRDYGVSCVGLSGCGPTCLSMVYCGLTKDSFYNPYEVAKYSMCNGYYVDGQGTSWNLMSAGAEYMGLSVQQGIVSADYIKNNLSEETPMICSMSPGDFTYTGHFIVLVGLDDNGDVIVNDPNSPINSKRHWAAEELTNQMKAVWKYSYF